MIDFIRLLEFCKQYVPDSIHAVFGSGTIIIICRLRK
jgi:hypothetical protein